MIEKFQKTCHEVLLSLQGSPSVVSVVVFGSVARGTESADSDLDLLIITKDGSLPHWKLRRLWEIGHERGIRVEALVTDPEFKGVDRTFVEGIYRQGKVLMGALPPLALQRLRLEPYRLISFDLRHLSQTQKMRLKRLLFGFRSKRKIKDKTYVNSYPGLLRKVGGIRVGRGAILVPEKDAWLVERRLIELGAHRRLLPVWIPEP